MSVKIEIPEIEIKFSEYLKKLFSGKEESLFFESIINECSPYIFGGLIKDFILGNENEHRDIDIVVDKISNKLKERIASYIVKKNQFGGLKLQVNDKIIDFWEIGKTWAISKERPLHKNYSEYLPSTSFFNVTAIIYSIKEEKFIMDQSFPKFLKSKTLGIVYEDNPYPELCIVKTYEFHTKYDLKISENFTI